MFTKLTRLELQRNQIVKIDTSKNPNLTNLNLSENQLETVNLDKNTLLIVVYLSNNKLRLISIQKSFKIERLWINDNELGEAIFCYHPQLWETHFENQRGNSSNIRLLHSKEKDKECLKWA
jgi:protein phosphatase 1 regulatory subunit 7